MGSQRHTGPKVGTRADGIFLNRLRGVFIFGGNRLKGGGLDFWVEPDFQVYLIDLIAIFCCVLKINQKQFCVHKFIKYGTQKYYQLVDRTQASPIPQTGLQQYSAKLGTPKLQGGAHSPLEVEPKF